MSVVKHKDLKWGVYTSPQSGEVEIERYIVENEDDLKAFAKKFPQVNIKVWDEILEKYIEPFNMLNNLKECLTQGYIIILTDLHRMSGMPTYCFESKADNTHPSSMHRKRIGK